jgi:D-lactate dehydrogenase (cytochrome)
MQDLVPFLAHALSPGAIATDAADRQSFETDFRGLIRHPAECVVLPRNAQEVAITVQACAARGVAIVPQGGNTGLVAGGVPAPDVRQVILSLRRMNAIRAVDVIDNTMTVEAGVVLAAAQAAAGEHDRLLPLSLAAEGSCQIGGNIATNAGGVQVVAYGTMRGLVLGLEVVLADGRIWNGLRSVRKDNTGLDPKHLFIGAEGTTGIVTAATLRLVPRPRRMATLLIAVRDAESALRLYVEFSGRFGSELTSFEYVTRFGMEMLRRHLPQLKHPLTGEHPAYVLCELASCDEARDFTPGMEAVLSGAMDQGIALDSAVAQSEAHRQAFWQLREGLPEGERAEGGAVKHDVAVPISRIPEILREIERIVAQEDLAPRLHVFGHIGDGNLHVNVLPPEGTRLEIYRQRSQSLTERIEDAVMNAGGSFSAEHGVGQTRIGSLLRYRSPIELGLMASVKAALDPRGMFNPGKVLPTVEHPLVS